MAADWISAADALRRLGVKPQTLYAYVSRGLVTARGDEADPRRSLYAADDVTRLVRRKARGRRPANAAGTALDAGEPVLDSAITVLAPGAIRYRGQDVADLARHATLEQTARLLWGCGADDPFARLKPHPGRVLGPDARARAFTLLAQRAATDPAAHERTDTQLRDDAASLLTDVVDAICGPPSRSGELHLRLARAWRADDARRSDLIRRMLVLTADHELNASTFAARVVASTGASLAAAALAGLAALSGPKHGGMTAAVADLFAETKRKGDAAAVVRLRLAAGRGLPGFGHPLYAGGDPRARNLAQACEWPDDLCAFAGVAEAAVGAPPNLDFALVATCRALGLPAEAPFALFAAGRTAGWIAHALEQAMAGELIRPRARYVGVSA